MQPYSDYEIAQRRIVERKSNRDRFRILLAVLAILVFIALVSTESAFCTVPIGIITALFALSYGIDLYYTSPNHAPSEAEIEEEMAWLFGEDWQDEFSTQAHALAQERIRKRRIGRWRFVGHLLLFIPINGLIIVTATHSAYTDKGNLLVIAFIWVVIFVAHALSTFPTQRMLAKREIRFGTTLQHELARMQPEKLKVKEKLKRGKYYIVGDDGELVEVEDEIVRLEEKPKRELNG